MTRAEECVFCAIASGELEASLVVEDRTALAFMDVSPITPGHTLVVPRAHATGLADLDVETGRHLFSVAMRVAAALRASGVRAEGVNVFLSDGAPAGQDVFHVHLHVIPRFPGDGLEVRYAPAAPDRATLDETAAALRAAVV